jgi:phospholipid/cholesterol/gamma-HCH transport system substrate-binding protein
MITKEQKFRLLIFMTASTALLLLLAGLFLLPKLTSRGHTYFVNFTGSSVNGLYEGAPVKYQGVEIGNVSRIRVNPSDLNSILVYAEIRKTFPVKQGMSATLTYSGITGLKFLEIAGGANEQEGLPPGEEIPTGRGLGEKAEDLVLNIDRAVSNLNQFLSPDNLAKISLFLENVERTSQVFSQVMEDKRPDLERSIENMESMLASFASMTDQMDGIARNLSQLTDKIDAASTETFANLSKRFSDEELGQVLKNLEEFIETANTGLKKLENVILVQQEEMKNTFESLGEAMANISAFSRELTEDPTLFLRSRKGKKK